jgi:transcriptional antiterminator RfaH
MNKQFNDDPIRVWIAVYTAPNAEILVRDAVRGLYDEDPYEVLLPTGMVEMMHARRKMMVDRPVFPRYVFVGIPHGRSWYPLKTVSGVSGVLSTRSEPQSLNPRAVALLRAAMEADAFTEDKVSPFKHGDKVEVLVGQTPVEAFVESIGRLLPGQRIDVMFRMFGKEHRQSFPVDQVRAA